MSGFVTTETYTQGQAAQDAKIDAININSFLDVLYPVGSVIYGTTFSNQYAFPENYDANYIPTILRAPIIAPYIVTAFPNLWTAHTQTPDTIKLHNSEGTLEVRKVTEFSIVSTNSETFVRVLFDRPFSTVTKAGLYWYTLEHANFSDTTFHWQKNSTKFADS